MTPVLLSERVLERRGPLKTVRRYYRGWHPELGGKLHRGLQGLETLVEAVVVSATHTAWAQNLPPHLRPAA